MPFLPDKILEDFEIEAFNKRVNDSAEGIISDSKFKLTTSNIPGLSLLIKIMIRSLEKSLSASLAPLFLGKKALSEGFSGIKEAFEGLVELFKNPIQFLLDEGINNVLSDFPFPIRFELGSETSDVLDLPQTDGRDFTSFFDYSYVGIFRSSALPSTGEYTTQQASIPEISQVIISKSTNGGIDNPLLQNLTNGDEIQISDDRFLGTFTVNSSFLLEEENSVRLNLTVKAIKNLESGTGETSIPGFSKSILSLDACQLAVRSFLQPDGTLKVPLKSLGIDIPLLSNLSLVIGDFSSVQDSSPSKQYIDRLSEETGVEFQEVLGGILKGNFPSLDFAKIQEETENGVERSNEQSKEDLVVFARILEIAVTNPCFLIGIIINYLKLLLLPIRIAGGVLKGLGEEITGPIKLLRTVIRGLTDPIGLICDLIAKGFLESMKPYIQVPLQAANLTWEEALNDPDDSKRGLQPLVSDMVCGDFARKLKNYKPNPAFFENLAGTLGTPGIEKNGPQITYDLKTVGIVPNEGQVLVNSDRASQISNFKVSSFSNTVENALPYLAFLSSGDEFNFRFADQFGRYRISAKSFANNGNFPYFNIDVIPVQTLFDLAKEKSIGDLMLDGVNIDSLKSSLEIENPDKAFLLIIERYLPIKVVAVWEAIKGLIAIFGGLALQIPSLIPAVLRSILGLNIGKSRAEIESQLDEDFSFPNVSVESAIEVVNLLFKPSGDSLLVEGTNSNPTGLLVITLDREARSAASSIIQNSKISTEPGIEDFFYDLYDSLESSGKDTAIYKSKLSPLPGKSTISNRYLNRLNISRNFKYPVLAPSRENFYWGAYNIKELGDSVKIRSTIMLKITNIYYFSNVITNRINLEKTEITVYGNNYEGNEVTRRVIYKGSILDALKKYKITNTSYDVRETYYDLRIKINREMDFVMNYALPSLLES